MQEIVKEQETGRMGNNIDNTSTQQKDCKECKQLQKTYSTRNYCQDTAKIINIQVKQIQIQF